LLSGGGVVRKVDFGDFLVMAGAVQVLAGLWLFDWRLAVVWIGLVMMLAGVTRLGNIRR
jgi:hypothetical protein